MSGLAESGTILKHGTGHIWCIPAVDTDLKALCPTLVYQLVECDRGKVTDQEFQLSFQLGAEIIMIVSQAMYGGSFLISDVVITLPSKPRPPPHRVDTVSIIKHLAKCGLKDIMAAVRIHIQIQ